MRASKRILVTATAVVLCLCGCTDKNGGDGSAKAPVSAAKASKAGEDYPKLGAEAVLIRVGTNEITKADVEALVDLRLKVIRFGLTEAQKDYVLNRGAVWVPIVASLPTNYRREIAILKWASENGLKPDAKDLVDFQKGFLRGCRAEGADWNVFMKANFTADERRTAERRVAIEATCSKAYKAYLAQHPVILKKEETDAFLKRVLDYNASAEATNALVWAKASNIWERVKGGADFKQLAYELTENVSEQDDGGAWGQYSLGELEKEDESALARLLASTDIGKVTPPVECDNGVAVVRVDAINDMHGNPITDGSRPFSAQYELSRIYLRLALTYEVLPREESEREIQIYHEKEAFNTFVKGLTKNDGAQYPCGRTLFKNAAHRAKMPQMIMQEGVTKEMLEKSHRNNMK